LASQRQVEQDPPEQVLQEEEALAPADADDEPPRRRAKADMTFLTRRLLQTGQGGFLPAPAEQSSSNTFEHFRHSNS
jgi:hypothetical protein